MYLTDNKGLTTIADGKDLASLQQETQHLAVWLEKTMTSLATLEPLLDKAWKIARKGQDGQENNIMQHARLCVKDVRTPPMYLAKSVRRMVQGKSSKARTGNRCISCPSRWPAGPSPISWTMRSGQGRVRVRS
jgi:hypothetical protein